MHLSTNFGKEIREKKSPGTDGLILLFFKFQPQKTRVAEPPLFWVAPAPEVRGPGADSGSDQTGSAPAPKKKASPALYTNTFWITFTVKTVMSCHNNKAFHFFCLPKKAAGAALKIGSGSRLQPTTKKPAPPLGLYPKSGGSGSKTVGFAFIFCGSESISFSQYGSESICFLNADQDPA